jgi:hypothetical protein
MKNGIAAITLLLLFGCTAPVPAPTLCQLPPHLASWNGVRLRLTGVVIGTIEHGYILKGIGCRNAVELIGVDGEMSDQAWDGQSNGHLFADVSGMIVRNPRFSLDAFPPESPYWFRISRVHQWQQVKGRPDEGIDM